MADRRIAWGAAFAVLLLAIGLRQFALAAWPLWLDESWSRWMAAQGWAGLYESAAHYDTHPPFYHSLLKLWTALVPATPYGLRLLSLLAGLAMLPLAWLCARQIPRLRAAVWPKLFAAALVAASPALVIASRQARPYALFALAFAVGLWAALALVRPDRIRSRAAAWSAYAAALAATAWLHSIGAVFAASLGGGLFLALATRGVLRSNLLPFAAANAAALLAWLPALFVILEQRRNWSAASWLHFSWLQVPSGLASGLAVAGVGGLLVFLLAAFGARLLLQNKDERPAALILLCAAIAPAAAAILLSIVSSPVFLPRTLVPSALPLMLLVAAALTGEKRRTLVAALSGGTLLLLAFVSALKVTAPPEEKWDQLAAWLQPRVRAGEEVWLLPNELVLPLGSASRSGLPGPIRGVPADFPAPSHSGPRPSGTRAVPGVTQADAARMVADAKRRKVGGVWVINRMPLLFDPSGSLRGALGNGRPDLRELRFAPMIVEHYPL